MLGQNILVWNVRGLKMRARRAVVREFLLQERVCLLCLLETKIDVLPSAMASELMGNSFDYVCLPAAGASGGSRWPGGMHGACPRNRVAPTRCPSPSR
jgi:exonuclease III